MNLLFIVFILVACSITSSFSEGALDKVSSAKVENNAVASALAPGQCPVAPGQAPYGCSGCQFCRDGSVCNLCTLAPGQCPVAPGQAPYGCSGCQFCRDGSVCNLCTTPK